MKTFVIEKGTHAPLRMPELWVGARTVIISAILDQSCTYEHGDSDQYAWNKLYGFGKGFDHHYDSVRIGWRWNVQNKCFEYCYYNYHKGLRVIEDERMPYSEPGEKVQFFLHIPNSYRWGFVLKPYFGGQKVAPHPVTIQVGVTNP